MFPYLQERLLLIFLFAEKYSSRVAQTLFESREVLDYLQSRLDGLDRMGTILEDVRTAINGVLSNSGDPVIRRIIELSDLMQKSWISEYTN